MMEQCGRYWAIRLADLQWTNTHCTTGQRSVTPHTHTLYDGAVRPVLGNQTGRPAVDKHTLYDWTAVSYTTHTHCMMEQCGRYWAIRLADLQWTNTHCTTGQRSVTPHTHTLYDGAVRPVLGNHWPTCSGQTHTVRLDSGQTHTHTVRLDSGQLHHTHTHCMTGQRSVGQSDWPPAHTHCTTGQRSVTPHTHTV